MMASKSIPWAEGLDIAQMTWFATPVGGFAPNLVVQLRTDAAQKKPGELADFDLGQLRDSGTKMFELVRKVPQDQATAQIEYTYDGPGGQRMRQIAWYLQRAAGVYSFTVTTPAGVGDEMRGALAGFFDALGR
jgi:hypothetical protein